MAVPRHNLNLTAEELRLMTKSLFMSGFSTNGRVRFEAALRDYLGVSQVTTVSSGRVALHLALAGLNLRAGDRVILPRYCFYSLVHVVQGLGMTPVFAPIDPCTFALDPARLKPLLASAQAVVLIHPFGQVAPIAEIGKLCEAAGVPLIEDASQATGGGLGEKKVGSMGAVGVFSLVTGKNLQTFGGGIVCSNNPSIATRMAELICTASDPGSQHVRQGVCSGLGRWFLTSPLGHNGLMHPLTRGLQRIAPHKLEAMFHEEHLEYDPDKPLFLLSHTQGSIGCLELAELDRRNRIRRNNALHLIDGLRGTSGIELPRFDTAADNTFNAVAIRLHGAAALQMTLRHSGVDTRSDYMSWYGPSRDFTEEVLYLPNHPGMDDDDVDRVIRAVRQAMAN